MLKYAFNLIDDGLVGQQLFAGEATRLAYMTDEAVEGRDAFLREARPGLDAVPPLLLAVSARLRAVSAVSAAEITSGGRGLAVRRLGERQDLRRRAPGTRTHVAVPLSSV